MNILVSISSLALVVICFNFCDGFYVQPPSNYPRYNIPAPANNNGKFPVIPQQSASINYGTNQPPFFQTLPSISAGSSSSPGSSSSFISGYRPLSAPTSSPYGVLSSRPASAAFNSYYPASGPNAASDNSFALQTAPTNFRQWPVPTTPSVSTFPLRPASLNNQMNRPVAAAPTSSKYGSSVTTNSQSQQQLKHQIIFTSTAKPPTYSVSFSTSARVGAGTRFGTTNYGNSSDSTIRATTTTGQSPAGDNGFSNWYGTSGGGVGGQPRGLVQSIPSYSPSPSSPLVGGRGKGEENVPKFNGQTDTIWGTGPWEGKVPQETTAHSQSTTSPKPISESRLKFSTEASHSSSYSPPAPKTQEKTRETKSHYPKTSPANPPSKNSQSDTYGLSSYSANLPSNSSQESFSLSSRYSWDTQSHQKEKGHYSDYRDYEHKSSDKTQQKNSFNVFERDNEIDSEDEDLSPIPEMEKKIRVKKGSFTWKGADGKVYEVRYTADALGMHLEDENEDESNSIPVPIRIVASEEEFLKELKSIESESENELESEEMDELEHSSSNRDSSFVDNSIPNSNKKYNSNSPLSEKEIHDLYRLQDAFKNSNELWNHREGDILFPPFNENNNGRVTPSPTKETPNIVISFGTGTSSTSPLYIPISSSYETNIERSYENPSSSFPNRNSYYVDPEPTPETQDYVSSSQNPNREISSPKKVSYAIRHHSYAKSHSSSDNHNNNNVPYEQTKEQPPISYNRRQYKRSNGHSEKILSKPITSKDSKDSNPQINQDSSSRKEKSSNSQAQNSPAVPSRQSRVNSRPSMFRNNFRQKYPN